MFERLDPVVAKGYVLSRSHFVFSHIRSNVPTPLLCSSRSWVDPLVLRGLLLFAFITVFYFFFFFFFPRGGS